MGSDESHGTATPAPAVTVIIPAYGVNAFIAEAVDSVLAQTYTDFQVVVVNDGAPPGETAELKAILARYDRRVRYLERENGGQAAARNSAMETHPTEFIALLDGDDYWDPNLLARQMELLQADPGLALVYADAHIFGDGIPRGTTYMQKDPSSGEVTLESLLALRCNVTMSTIVARRACIAEVGFFDPGLRYSEDFDLWFKMAHRRMRMAYRTEPLAYRRVRGNALSANDVKMNNGSLFVLERFAQEFDLTRREREALEATVRRIRADVALGEAKLRLMRNEFTPAAEHLRAVDPEYATWKIRWARAALRKSPRAVRAAFLALEHLRQARRRWELPRGGGSPPGGDDARDDARDASRPTEGKPKRPRRKSV